VKLSLACLVHKNEGILSYRRGRGEGGEREGEFWN